MLRTYKFRLYPTKENEQILLWTLDKCRFVYNYLLEQKSNSNMRRGDMQSLLPKLKKEKPELQNVYSKTLQYENYRLHSNIITLSRLKKNGKRVGKLRFKGRAWFKTFTYNQSGFSITEHNTRFDTLHLSKIGDIPMLMHRKIEGNIKQITIKNSPSGKWFVSITAETKEKAKPTEKNKKVGIDLGLNSYVHDSYNNRIDNPRCLNRSLRKLAREQRRLSRKKKASKNKEKQRVKVARVYEKIVSQRNDFLHKLSRHYANNYSFISVEKLNINGMTRNRYLARSIIDASWSRFIRMLEYKAESAGIQVMKVDPTGTTQKCSQCGSIVRKSLAMRTHKCSCGFVADRDYNSAINILKKALGQELPEFTPVETESLPLNWYDARFACVHPEKGQVQSQKQEAPLRNMGVVHIYKGKTRYHS